MPEDIRGRVQRLIELAVAPSANETEARNAAMAACRLIKEHRLLTAAPAPQQVRMHVSGGGIAFDMQDAFDDLFGRVSRQQRVRPTRPPPEHRVEGEAPKAHFPKDPRARTFILGRPTNCSYCLEEIQVRAMVIVSHRSVFHPACYEAATTP
jgi:hypothetical protein